MNFKNIAIKGLAALALLALGYFAGNSHLIPFGATLNPTGPVHYSAESFLQGLTAGLRGQFQVDNAGVVTVNGVSDTTYRASAMTQATTTDCSFGPTVGTTTLRFFTANVTSGTTTASTFTLATSTSPSASTSPIASKSVAAGAQVTFDWDGGAGNSIVAPGTYINFTQSGGNGTFSNTGTCTARLGNVN
jgi:hypothetical protein